MDKWEELKLLINADLSWPVHYSLDRNYEKGVLLRIKDRMEYLEQKEKNNEIHSTNGIDTISSS